MPDFVSHFLMARNLLFDLQGEIADIAYRDTNAFYWGAQGPDALTYRGAGVPEAVAKQAVALHGANPSSVFLFASKIVLESKGTKQYEQVLPFFFGFISHYCLDKNANPYIYSMQLRQRAKQQASDELIHARLESAIDSELYAHYHKKDVTDFYPAKFYASDELLTIAMTSFYYKLIRDISRVQIPHDDISPCFNDMLEKNKAFLSPMGKIKLLPAIIADFISGGGLMTARFKPRTPPAGEEDILNLKKAPWTNPWEPATQLKLSYVEIIENSVKEAKIMINAFNSMLITGNIQPLNLVKPFDCGNPAYHPASARIIHTAAKGDDLPPAASPAPPPADDLEEPEQ